MNKKDKIDIYLYYRDSCIRMKEFEEQESDKRIRFFICLVGGIIAFLGYLGKDYQDQSSLIWIGIASLVILFAYGILTIARIIERSAMIDSLILSIHDYNSSIEELDSSIAEVLTKAYHPPVPAQFKGTYAQFMYLTQSLLIFGIVILIGKKYELSFLCTIPIAFIFGAVTSIILFLWSQYKRRKGNFS